MNENALEELRHEKWEKKNFRTKLFYLFPRKIDSIFEVCFAVGLEGFSLNTNRHMCVKNPLWGEHKRRKKKTDIEFQKCATHIWPSSDPFSCLEKFLSDPPTVLFERPYTDKTLSNIFRKQMKY